MRHRQQAGVAQARAQVVQGDGASPVQALAPADDGLQGQAGLVGLGADELDGVQVVLEGEGHLGRPPLAKVAEQRGAVRMPKASGRSGPWGLMRMTVSGWRWAMRRAASSRASMVFCVARSRPIPTSWTRRADGARCRRIRCSPRSLTSPERIIAPAGRKPSASGCDRRIHGRVDAPASVNPACRQAGVP